MNARMLMGALALSAIVQVGTAAAQAATQFDAQTFYQENCRKCHGVRGTPPKTMKAKFPKIATFDAAFIASHSQDSIVKVLTKGKGEDMKSFADKLKSPEEKAAVAKYVHALAAKAHPGS